MLTPAYLTKVPDRLVDLYAQVEADMLADMARRINGYDMFIPAAQHQLQMLEEMGGLREDIIAQLAKVSGKSKAELVTIMQEAGVQTLRTDDAIYRAVGLTPAPLTASLPMQQTLQAGLNKTYGLFDNLTKTTANTATRQFERVLDRAYMQVSSGAFSPDVAVKNAIKDLCAQGVEVIRYPTGHVDTMEVAVRRATITGINQTTGKLQELRMDEMGCDLVEVTAHSGARPEHAEWQGGIFSRSGKSKKYKGLVEATGYGTGPGLMGWNCSHSFRPYFEGMPRTYSNELLKEYEESTVEYNGRKMAMYEAMQRQREIERNIRRWKREFVAMDAAGLDTTQAAAKLSAWQGRQRAFLQETGLRRQAGRESIAGWGRSEASRAKAAQEPKEYRDFMNVHAAKSHKELLPKHREALIAKEKLSGYALNKDHPVGKNKAIVFESVLGYTVDNQDLLVQRVRAELSKVRAIAQEETLHGKLFHTSMMIKGANGRFATVRTAWIFDNGSEIPRLVTIYVE